MANNKSISRKSKIMLICGFLFFINPVPMGFDILPDVFGCILLFLGLTQCAYFDGSVDTARRFIGYLTIVEAIKLFTMRSVMLAEISSNRMLFVTLFSIAEGILYVIIFKYLFDGISYFSARNDCNETLNRCEGIMFLSNLAFFSRIVATLVPELWPLIELELYIETDFDVADSLADIISAKPVVILLLSLVAFITLIWWYVSIVRLLIVFHKESGEGLDVRYNAEYTSQPEKGLPKRLRIGCWLIYAALFFAIDFTLDEKRVIPASFMFLILFAATFAFKGISRFERTKRYALPAFVLLFGAERFQAVFVPYGAVAIVETDIWIVAVDAVICLVAIPVCLLCVRGFLADIRELSANLGVTVMPTSGAWLWYCLSVVFWSIGYVVPYFYGNVSSLRFISACIFILLSAKRLSDIKEEFAEKQKML